MSKNHLFTQKSLSETILQSLNTLPVAGILQGVRVLKKGLNGKRIVFFPSKKNSALMPCESRLEADSCLNLEFTPSVVSYRTQPFTMALGRNEFYTPDSVHIDKLGTKTVREVKFSGVLEKKELQDRLEKIRGILHRNGINFEVLTEKHLQKNVSNKNYKYLYRCSHLRYHDIQIQYSLEILSSIPNPFTLRNFRLKCIEKNLPPLIADYCIFSGKASYDESKMLTPDSQIWKMEVSS